MDLTQLDAEIAKDETGVLVPLFQKNGDPYTAADGAPSTVTVVGSESARYRAAKSDIMRRALNQRRTKLEPADIARNRVDLAVAAVIEWAGWEAGGKPAACTPDNVRSLMRAEHILEQVEAGISGHADFFSRPSTNS